MANVAARLAGPIVGTGAEDTLFTVAGSTIVTIQCVRVVNNTAGALTFKMSIGADADGTRIFPTGFSVPANGLIKDGGFDVVMVAAETLRWNAPAGLTVTVSGIKTT